MLRIAKSLITIAAVAAIAVGATGAYFSDEVKISNNSITTGSIDINVDGVNDNSHQSYVLSDMKPGYIKNSDFTVNNTGSNPANIYKTVNVTRNDANLAAVIDYHLSVVIPGVSGDWNQTLYDYNITLSGVNDSKVFLGMLPPDTSMNVTESYKMEDVGNAYQNQTLGFDITVDAEQLQGTLVLENKNPANWQILGSDGISGTLSYGVMDTNFNFTFSGVAPLANTPYTLVIGDNPYLGGTTLATATSGAGGIINIPAASVDLGTKTNQKVWLVLSSDWNTAGMTGWNPSSYLFETGLIDYYKS